MSKRTAILLAATLLLASFGFANDKKSILPPYVLNAHAVAVLVDPFLVYEGNIDNPLDNVAAWRYVAKDGLRLSTVPAVSEFRKALAEAEKAAAKKP
jgi:hypothetical protein